MRCGICGEEDLFSAVAQQPACAVCVVGLGMRTPVTQDAVAKMRERLGLKPGEFRGGDRAAEVRAILGRS